MGSADLLDSLIPLAMGTPLPLSWRLALVTAYPEPPLELAKWALLPNATLAFRMMCMGTWNDLLLRDVARLWAALAMLVKAPSMAGVEVAGVILTWPDASLFATPLLALGVRLNGVVGAYASDVLLQVRAWLRNA